MYIEQKGRREPLRVRKEPVGGVVWRNGGMSKVQLCMCEHFVMKQLTQLIEKKNCLRPKE